MKYSEENLKKLLEQVKLKNERNLKLAAEALKVPISELRPQQVSPPASEAKEFVPTLKNNFSRVASPMLKTRFTYAARWEKATYGHTWLSLDDMAQLWTDASLRSAVDVRKEHWLDSPPATYHANELSLFAVDRMGGEEIYLIWPPSVGDEPKVVAYFLDDRRDFENLAKLWEFYISAK
jgi:hypothetical protein